MSSQARAGQELEWSWWFVCAQGVAFAGPAACMAICSALTPSGVAHSASPGNTTVAIVVGVLSISFALSSWARAGLYCNHQVRHARAGHW